MTSNLTELPGSTKRLEALQSILDNAAGQLIQQPTSEQSDETGSIIYMGNLHDSFPRALITDPILNSEEIHTWMLMRLEIQDQYSIARVPDHDDLANALKCLRPVVRRNLQVLRALRWITVGREVRGEDGLYRGTVYLQHDEPLSLGETLELDEHYVDFLQEQHSNSALKRLSDIKQAVLKHVNFQLFTDEDALVPPSRSSRFNRAAKYQQHGNPLETPLACPAEVLEPNNEVNCYQSPTIPKPIQHRLNHQEQKDDIYRGRDHVGNPNMVTNGEKQADIAENRHNRDHVGYSYMVNSLSSSSGSNNKYISNTTTTTTDSIANLDIPDLNIPRCLSLSDDARAWTLDLVRRLPPDKQQSMIDYANHRYLQGQRGELQALRSPILYLQSLVESVEKGTFDENFGHIELTASSAASTRKPKSGKDQNLNRDQIRKLMGEIGHLEHMIKHVGEPMRADLEEQKNQLINELETLEAMNQQRAEASG